MARLERIVSHIKNLLLPAGPQVRIPRGGLLRGLKFEIDFRNQVQIYLGLSEREVIPWFEKFTRRVHTAIDIGAAEGRYTLPLLARTSAKKIIACEPTARRERLRANLQRNHLADDPRLLVVPQFIGAHESDGTRTLDSLLPYISFPCFAKVDVEGAEADVLRGAAEILRQPGVSWIIETHSAELEEECVGLLQAAGFRTEIIRNAGWRRFVPLPGLGPIGHSRWLAATNEPSLLGS